MRLEGNTLQPYHCCILSL